MTNETPINMKMMTMKISTATHARLNALMKCKLKQLLRTMISEDIFPSLLPPWN